MWSRDLCDASLGMRVSAVTLALAPHRLELLRRIVHAWEHDGRYSSPAFITPVLYNKSQLVEPPPHYIAQPCLVLRKSQPIPSRLNASTDTRSTPSTAESLTLT
jgi:hypothetical protein